MENLRSDNGAGAIEAEAEPDQPVRRSLLPGTMSIEFASPDIVRQLKILETQAEMTRRIMDTNNVSMFTSTYTVDI